MVQVTGHPEDLGAVRLEFLQTEIKQPHVIGLEAENSVLLQECFVDVQKGTVGQSALGVTRLGPRIAEIQINAIERVGTYVVGEKLRVPDQKPKIVSRPLLFCRHRLFQRDTAHVGDPLHGDKVHVGMLLRHADGKIALAAADLQMDGAGIVVKDSVKAVL